ncbi:hypothetical protein HDE_05629 [Halotydeus destructor]|nr:hypothetical protein HDE_05629 [Halotydeus destructor]
MNSSVLATKVDMTWKSCTLAYFVMATIGCSIQIYHVSHEYFRFETVTELYVNKPELAKPPSMIVCAQLEEDPDDVQIQVDENSPLQDDTNYTGLPVDDYFALTPSGDQVLDSCAIDAPTTIDRMEIKGRECCAALKVDKFFKHTYLCYSFKSRAKKYYSTKLLANSPYGPRFYQIKLRPLFLKSAYVYYYVHDRYLDFHGASSGFTEVFRGLNYTSGIGKANFVTLSYKRYKSKYLKKPYITNCHDYTSEVFQSADHCIEVCVLRKTLERFKLVPLTIALYTPHKEKFMTADELQNVTINRIMTNISNFCESRCPKPDCERNDLTPKVISTGKELSHRSGHVHQQ